MYAKLLRIYDVVITLLLDLEVDNAHKKSIRLFNTIRGNEEHK